MKKSKRTRRKVWQLGWSGMKQAWIEVDRLDKRLVVDDWYHPKAGTLCINSKGSLDVCKSRYEVPPRDPFKGHTMYTFKYSKDSTSTSYLVRVKKGKKFRFKGKLYTSKDNPTKE